LDSGSVPCTYITQCNHPLLPMFILDWSQPILEVGSQYSWYSWVSVVVFTMPFVTVMNVTVWSWIGSQLSCPFLLFYRLIHHVVEYLDPRVGLRSAFVQWPLFS